jgi:hypothetical protein
MSASGKGMKRAKYNPSPSSTSKEGGGNPTVQTLNRDKQINTPTRTKRAKK